MPNTLSEMTEGGLDDTDSYAQKSKKARKTPNMLSKPKSLMKTQLRHLSPNVVGRAIRRFRVAKTVQMPLLGLCAITQR